MLTRRRFECDSMWCVRIYNNKINSTLPENMILATVPTLSFTSLLSISDSTWIFFQVEVPLVCKWNKAWLHYVLVALWASTRQWAAWKTRYPGHSLLISLLSNLLNWWPKTKSFLFHQSYATASFIKYFALFLTKELIWKLIVVHRFEAVGLICLYC